MKSTKHDRIFDILSVVAQDVTDFGSARLASAIVFGNRIISIGINRRKSHPFQAKYAKNKSAIYLHSEISAIKNSLNHIQASELKNASLYVCRMKHIVPGSHYFTFGKACPCEGCLRAITDFEIKNVYYTTEDGYEKL